MKLHHPATKRTLVVVSATETHYVAARNSKSGPKTWVDKRDVGPEKEWRKIEEFEK